MGSSNSPHLTIYYKNIKDYYEYTKLNVIAIILPQKSLHFVSKEICTIRRRVRLCSTEASFTQWTVLFKYVVRKYLMSNIKK